MSTQYGKATVYSTTGSFSITGVALAGSQLFEGVNTTHQSNINSLTGYDGEIINYTENQCAKAIAITFVPIGSTGTNTLAAASSSLFLPGTIKKVTLANMVDSNLNGDYIYQNGAGWNTTKDGYASCQMNLVKYTNASTETLTTAVS